MFNEHKLSLAAKAIPIPGTDRSLASFDQRRALWEKPKPEANFATLDWVGNYLGLPSEDIGSWKIRHGVIELRSPFEAWGVTVGLAVRGADRALTRIGGSFTKEQFTEGVELISDRVVEKMPIALVAEGWIQLGLSIGTVSTFILMNSNPEMFGLFTKVALVNALALAARPGRRFEDWSVNESIPALGEYFADENARQAIENLWTVRDVAAVQTEIWTGLREGGIALSQEQFKAVYGQMDRETQGKLTYYRRCQMSNNPQLPLNATAEMVTHCFRIVYSQQEASSRIQNGIELAQRFS